MSETLDLLENLLDRNSLVNHSAALMG